jgi:prevent-host-death family protein
MLYQSRKWRTSPMTKTVNIHEAKTHLSRLLDALRNGDKIVIAKAGQPVARLIAFDSKVNPRVLGRLKGKIKTGEDFDDELPKSIQPWSRS